MATLFSSPLSLQKGLFSLNGCGLQSCVLQSCVSQLTGGSTIFNSAIHSYFPAYNSHHSSCCPASGASYHKAILKLADQVDNISHSFASWVQYPKLRKHFMQYCMESLHCNAN